MKLEFIGADHEVTGSCHYLKVGTLNILVDFGMEQGRDVYENTKLPVTPSEVDFVFITHAHIDHTGMLPKLYHDGFRGQIITTEPTMDLCDIMLRDSAHIQTAEAEYRNKRLARKGIYQKIVPAYTMEDAMNVMKLFRSFKYNKKYQLCNGVEFRFTDVGHLLGSASIELWLTENKNGVASGNPVGAPEGTVTKKIVFSGDIGNINQPLLRNPAYTTAADYVVMESTYGDRLHEKRDGDNKNAIAEIIRNTLLRGGNVVIPSFAVGRTQEMLYFIRKIKLEGLFPEMPDFPVYVDSPLAVQATEVFRD
ncbi:MAG: MBL fold metallo-hydrolase, partial [Clostridiales bacterium]|nr:MBL fold metallo-hydrolase [Clostridiales bacterium]